MLTMSNYFLFHEHAMKFQALLSRERPADVFVIPIYAFASIQIPVFWGFPFQPFLVLVAHYSSFKAFCFYIYNMTYITL